MKSRVASILFLIACAISTLAQSPEFNEPWKNPNVALAIDPFEGNAIDWEARDGQARGGHHSSRDHRRPSR
jgi:hypothetical protein